MRKIALHSNSSCCSLHQETSFALLRRQLAVHGVVPLQFLNNTAMVSFVP